MGAPDRAVADVCIRRRIAGDRGGTGSPLEVRVAVIGNVDSGKSTMVSRPGPLAASAGTLSCTSDRSGHHARSDNEQPEQTASGRPLRGGAPSLPPALLSLSLPASITLCALSQVGVLTRSVLDDGRGFARSKVFKHGHEESTGVQGGQLLGMGG